MENINFANLNCNVKECGAEILRMRNRKARYKRNKNKQLEPVSSTFDIPFMFHYFGRLFWNVRFWMIIDDSCISLRMQCQFLCLLWMLLKKFRLGRWGFRNNLGLVDEVLIDALSFHGALVWFTESVVIFFFHLITILWCNNKSLVLVGRNCFNIVHPAVAYCKGISTDILWCGFDLGKCWSMKERKQLLHEVYWTAPMKSHLTRAKHEKKIGKETINTNEKKQDSIIRL